MKFILGEIFVLYKDIAKYVRILTILALWVVTFYISGNLFGGDVMLPTPFTEANSSDITVIQNTDYQTYDIGLNLDDYALMLSPYDPELGGTNGQYPYDITASGERVLDWIDKGGAACPMEIPFYTKIEIEGVVHTCIDRGSFINMVAKGEHDVALANYHKVPYYPADENHIWIDVLSSASTHGDKYYYTELVYNWGIVTETYSPVQATPIQPQSCPIYPPYENGVLSQGVHGSDYSPPQPNSLDYVGGRGVNVLSPISGVVTVNEIRYFGANNEYGNTTIIIENDCYSVLMYHGDWTAHVGEEVEMGGPVGTEGNNGYTFDEYDNYCGTGSSCGYHTHMYTFDKILGVGIDPRERYTE